MTRINTHYKADAVATAGTSTATNPDAANTQNDMQELIAEIDQYLDENGEWLSDEQIEKIKNMKFMAAGISELAPYADYQQAYAANGADPQQDYIDLPESLPDKWGSLPDNYVTQDAYGEDIVGDDYTSYGDYMGTVTIPNSGNPSSPNAFAFQMTDDMVSVTTESRGRDIVLTVEYADHHKESWVIRDGTTRPEPFVISAFGLSHGVTIDCSRTIRVNQYQGRSGIYIRGSEAEEGDTIIGSQADDLIVGGGGNDTIDGQAGNDTIFGDEGPGALGVDGYVPGSFVESNGGNDTIIGGAGNDMIYTQGGIDTVSEADVANGESINEYEYTNEDVPDALPAPDAWLDPATNEDWVVTDAPKNGTYVVENNNPDGFGGELNITMPPGYNMAYAEESADGSLVITFVGEAGTFRVKIEDFFNQGFGDGGDPRNSIVTLNIQGTSEDDIIDFGKVAVTSQVINIEGGNGEDIILGAGNAMLKDGVDIDPDTLLSSQNNRDSELDDYVEVEGVFKNSHEDDDPSVADGYRAEVNDDGQIEVTAEGTTEQSESLKLQAPYGYDHGYVTQDEDGNVYVVLVKRGEEGGAAETIVIKVDEELFAPSGKLEGYGDIRLFDENGNRLELFEISMNEEDYLIDGGANRDLIFTQKDGRLAPDPEDDIVEDAIDFDIPEIEPPVAPAVKVEDPEDPPKDPEDPPDDPENPPDDA